MNRSNPMMVISAAARDVLERGYREHLQESYPNLFALHDAAWRSGLRTNWGA